jgi:predicted dehydrogenase
MIDRPLRWGLLSTARINRAVIPPLNESPRHEVRAVASRDPDRAAAYAREWGIPVVHASYDALLADPEIDVVYNPLPNSLHAEWTIRAAEAGKHVLCEKPLALSVDEVDAIAAAASRAGVVVTEAFMYRHHPQTLRLKALVDGGEIGALRLVRGAFSFTLARPADDPRRIPELGGGSLWDVGCYPVSMARYLVGREPISVVGWQQATGSGIDELFAGMLDFGDVFAQFDSGFSVPFRTHLEVVGTDGTITVPAPFKPGLSAELIVTRQAETTTIAIEGQALYSGEVEDLFDAIRLGRAPRVTLADSRGNTAALVALLASARTRGDGT